MKTAVEGLLTTSYQNLALDRDDRAAGLKRVALEVYRAYTTKSRTPAGKP